MLVDPDKLRKALWQLAKNAGAGDYEADILSDSIVEAELRGMASHGVVRYPAYIERISMGLYAVNTAPRITKDAGTLLLIDGCNGIGAPMAMQVMQLCEERAREKGVCFAGVNHGNHFGCGAYYTGHAARQGMIGLALANANAWVTPFGGTKRRLGTNPLSVAVPCGDQPPMIVDMATSEAAHGKVVVADKNGVSVPLGWGVDACGAPCTDPHAILNGGALLPFGGAKGYGISLVIEILCSALAGGKKSTEVGSTFAREQIVGTGFFMGAICVEKLVDPEVFAARVQDIFADMRSAAGDESPVYIPGEIEDGRKERMLRDGIEISDAIYSELQQLAEQFHICLDVAL